MPKQSFPSSPWVILIIVLLASMAAPLNQFKVPPVMPLLMGAFGASAAQAGLLMSLFAITGLLLAIPAGFIFQKLGYRLTGMIAILSLVIGAGWGALSRGFDSMLAGRFIEGAGMSLMSVVAPAVIALWFSPESRGKAMGVWAIWVPLGSTIMFLLAPSLAGRWNWPGVWWFGCFYAILAGILYFGFLKSRAEQTLPPNGKISPAKDPHFGLKKVLSNRDLWLNSFLFGCFNFVFIGFVTWAPTFLQQARGISLARAAFLVSLTSILAIIACPTSGWISDRTGTRKRVAVFPMILIAPLFPLSFYAAETGFLFLAILVGFIGGFVPTGVFSGAAEAVEDERLGGMAMAVIQIGQNAGMLLGPLVTGWVIESPGGWQAAFWLLAPVSILGAGAGWISRIR
ncbi:MAG: MFS transporter [Syntrophaceae bacterium]|jgi:MFS family permease|nr:MFS transporter [Syntrophaceae bacterium]